MKPIQNPVNLSVFRYESFFKVYEDLKNKVNFYNILKNVNIFAANDQEIEEEYTIKPNDSWTFISYKFYSTIELWWLVCEYNGIENPTKFPEAGTKIKILRSSYVHPVISELKKQLNR